MPLLTDDGSAWWIEPRGELRPAVGDEDGDTRTISEVEKGEVE